MMRVRKYNMIFLLIPLLFLFSTHRSAAQTLELFGGNIANGAITGTAIGAAVMGMQNGGSITPLRIGLGTGILAGTAIAVYDLVTLPQGQTFFISGVFNDGQNSSIIILLDTFYGALAGAGIGTAVILINNSSFPKGLQYGASAGALGGLAFGLADSFIFAERNRDFIAQNRSLNSSAVQLHFGDTEVGFMRLDVTFIPDFDSSTSSISLEPVLNLVTIRSRF